MSLKKWVTTFLYGLCMGASDIVPGISGGTIAFIMGFYEDLLYSINSLNTRAFFLLLSFRLKDFFQCVRWKFLTALGLGVITAFITLAALFNFLLNHELYRCFLYSGFLGLILASTYFCAKQLKRWHLKHILSLLAGIITAFFLTGNAIQFLSEEPLFDVALPITNPIALDETKPIRNYDPHTHRLKEVPQSTLATMLAKQLVPNNTAVYSHAIQQQGIITDFTLPHHASFIDGWIICCGAIAISAMLLPGISGSYLLTILGMYSVVIAALVDFINGVKAGSFDVDAFSILANMALGIFLGALIFSRVVIWLLNHYRECTIALLTGFMIGALRSVWPFWAYDYALQPLKLERGAQLELLHPILPSLDSSLFLISLLFMVSGFILVLSLEYIAEKISATSS